jgi:S-formylglutathione hydrolase FrmB
LAAAGKKQGGKLMALIEVNFFSNVLGTQCQANVILPQSAQNIGVKQYYSLVAKGKKAYPVLYLLHGATEDYTTWLRYTSLERYASGKGLAVVMPSGHLSGYAKMAHGQDYAQFLAKELPQIMSGFFPISTKREDTFVGGSSMGGMGALSLGLVHPEVYSAIGCFSSGNLNIHIPGAARQPVFGKRKSGKAAFDEVVFGVKNRADAAGNPSYDCFVMAEAAIKAKKKLPRIFHCIGKDDFLLENAKDTAKWFKAHKQFDYEFHTGPGAHTWDFWDAWLKKFLEWL